jgi:hypothetical protein
MLFRKEKAYFLEDLANPEVPCLCGHSAEVAADAAEDESASESEDEADYDPLRELQLQLDLANCTGSMRTDITAIRAAEEVDGDR